MHIASMKTEVVSELMLKVQSRLEEYFDYKVK